MARTQAECLRHYGRDGISARAASGMPGEDEGEGMLAIIGETLKEEEQPIREAQARPEGSS